MEPRFNEPLFYEVLDITNDVLCPGQSSTVASCAHVLSLKNCENSIFAGISDLIDIAAEGKKKVILRPLDKI